MNGDETTENSENRDLAVGTVLAVLAVGGIAALAYGALALCIWRA